MGKGRAIGWSLVFLAGGLSVVLSVLWVFARPMAEGGIGPTSAIALQAVVLLAVFAGMTWLVGVKALRFGAADLRLTPAPAGVRGFWRGLAIGGLLAGLAMVIAVPLGHAAWRDDGGTLSAWLGSVGVTAALLFPAALAEELMFRGVPLVALSRAFGRLPAMLALSLLFGLGHLFNPGITLLAVLNIALAGLWLGAAFFSAGGLWTATGAHLGWNLALAALAAPVSGWPFPMPALDYGPGGPAWLTGGEFGPEGGVIASLCLIGGLYYLSRRNVSEVQT
ncbi:MAG: CPBP family intramembrane metalloprotease [Gemmatimonadales bacterium]|nr:CPBP family intramembrane metalloprotease [Gemmatimonadales bacterium]